MSPNGREVSNWAINLIIEVTYDIIIPHRTNKMNIYYRSFSHVTTIGQLEPNDLSIVYLHIKLNLTSTSNLVRLNLLWDLARSRHF